MAICALVQVDVTAECRKRAETVTGAIGFDPPSFKAKPRAVRSAGRHQVSDRHRAHRP
jgi:hypothetical protein